MHFRNSTEFQTQNEKAVNPAKPCVKILRARNCRRRFIKNLLPEKRKENM